MRLDLGFRNVNLFIISMSSKPQEVYQFIKKNQLYDLQILINPPRQKRYTGQRVYSVRNMGTILLLDNRGILRHQQKGWSQDSDLSMQNQVKFLMGQPVPGYGWRNDLKADYNRFQEYLLDDNKNGALNILDNILPAEELSVRANYDNVPQQFRRTCVELLHIAVQNWTATLGQAIKITIVEEDNATAHLTVVFHTQVIARNDETSTRTVCSECIVLRKRDMIGQSASGLTAKPIIANIGIGHTSGGSTHTRQALIHLIGRSIGFALGLGASKMADSIMIENGESQNLSVHPSVEDIVIIRQRMIAAQGSLMTTYGEANKQNHAMKSRDKLNELIGKDPLMQSTYQRTMRRMAAVKQLRDILKKDTNGDNAELTQEQLQGIVAMDPELAPAHYWLGKNLEKNNKFDEALKEYELATLHDPYNNDYRLSRNRLKGKLPSSKRD